MTFTVSPSAAASSAVTYNIDRILVSPALLRQFRGSHVEFPPMQAPNESAQYLQLQQ